MMNKHLDTNAKVRQALSPEKIYQDLLKSYEVPATKSKQDMWEAINSKIAEEEPVVDSSSKVVPIWRWLGTAVAAGL